MLLDAGPWTKLNKLDWLSLDVGFRLGFRPDVAVSIVESAVRVVDADVEALFLKQLFSCLGFHRHDLLLLGLELLQSYSLLCLAGNLLDVQLVFNQE